MSALRAHLAAQAARRAAAEQLPAPRPRPVGLLRRLRRAVAR